MAAIERYPPPQRFGAILLHQWNIKADPLFRSEPNQVKRRGGVRRFNKSINPKPVL
jgi:hypothetical protein